MGKKLNFADFEKIEKILSHRADWKRLSLDKQASLIGKLARKIEGTNVPDAILNKVAAAL